jgi:hypothetical protein
VLLKEIKEIVRRVVQEYNCIIRPPRLVRGNAVLDPTTNNEFEAEILLLQALYPRKNVLKRGTILFENFDSNLDPDQAFHGLV